MSEGAVTTAALLVLVVVVALAAIFLLGPQLADLLNGLTADLLS